MTEPPTGSPADSPTDSWPKIRARRTLPVSRWMQIVEREVEFAPGAPTETYHAIGQGDYVAILALTPERRIPLVRQYRPACEAFTLELPAGMVEAGEDPAAACRRELLEETGLTARRITPLAANHPCTARLSNRIHSFFVEAGGPSADFRPEPGIAVELVTEGELAQTIRAGRLDLHLHLGTVFLAVLRGLLDPAIVARP
jgi:8-oxo-dGTP pyrophosphatase MutT (NUDIX family)